MKTEEPSTTHIGAVDSNVNEKDYSPYPSRDVATQLVDTLVAGDITPEEERSALRRIDFVLMPVMFISFALQYMDKSCLSGGILFGILTDLDLEKM